MSRSEHTRRTGYVLKMYPRFSETFVVNEVLALEDAGEHLEIFSLRLPVDGRFHDLLAEVRAPVSYLPQRPNTAELWEVMRRGIDTLPRLCVDLSELLALPPHDAAAAVQLALDVQEHGITHLHAHFGSVATDVARAAARLTGISYSFTAHAKDIFHIDVSSDDLRRKLADASAVVTVSDYNLHHLRSRYGAAADRVVRVYNGIDLDRFPFSAPTRRPPVVAGVGRLVPKKGFAHLVDAVALLAETRPDVRLDLVGTGEQEQALRDQVTALGLDAQVRFHGGLPQGQIREVVREAAVLAAPCVVAPDGNRDGLPTVLLESMALGTPCVATPVTGVPEAVWHDDTGLLVPEGDPVALARALARLIDDAWLRERLAARARALVEREFDVHRNSAQVRDVLAGATGATEPRVVA